MDKPLRVEPKSPVAALASGTPRDVRRDHSAGLARREGETEGEPFEETLDARQRAHARDAADGELAGALARLALLEDAAGGLDTALLGADLARCVALGQELEWMVDEWRAVAARLVLYGGWPDSRARCVRLLGRLSAARGLLGRVSGRRFDALDAQLAAAQAEAARA
ncbi:hypothetical protein [Crenobacter caeni]|uniref:Uncharacterized protein n=1 Tax=Crenobacter caeni TaxID=2705474 RepID=A0A6B2KV94_9NEIS|nr:hypothetical protein [Crenobacter caeni]NDV13923.1 hypothetical protein [Crenobacter caeni]